MTEYRSAFYPDHALESFDVQRTSNDSGGYYGRAVWRGPQGATAATYCGCLHFDPDSALSCIKRWHEIRLPDSGEIALPDVIEGAVAPEDIVRANMRAAGFPVGSAADARAIRAEAERWAPDFTAAGRAEGGIVIDYPEAASE